MPKQIITVKLGGENRTAERLAYVDKSYPGPDLTECPTCNAGRDLCAGCSAPLGASQYTPDSANAPTFCSFECYMTEG